MAMSDAKSVLAANEVYSIDVVAVIVVDAISGANVKVVAIVEQNHPPL
jgi:hypothetical protein